MDLISDFIYLLEPRLATYQYVTSLKYSFPANYQVSKVRKAAYMNIIEAILNNMYDQYIVVWHLRSVSNVRHRHM